MTFQELIKDAPLIIQRKLEQLKFLRERPDYHPEPSAFHHIKIVTERLEPTNNPNLILSGILHDICKFDTVEMNPKTGYPRSPGHDDSAFELIVNNMLVRQFCVNNGADLNQVALICKYHMRFHQLGKMKPAKREKTIEDWIELGIWEDLKIFGAADNMLVDFDLSNLDKSWKSHN